MIDRRVLWAVWEMEHRLADIDVGTLHRDVNLSASRFAHLFSRDTGCSPVRYLRALRLERARTLLERTFLSVKEVMGQVGFADPSHFAKDFRRYHGRSPSKLRELRNDDERSRFLTAHLALVEAGAAARQRHFSEIRQQTEEPAHEC